MHVPVEGFDIRYTLGIPISKELFMILANTDYSNEHLAKALNLNLQTYVRNILNPTTIYLNMIASLKPDLSVSQYEDLAALLHSTIDL